MRVGLDATPLLGTRTGVGRYVAGLLSALDVDVTLTAFTWRGVADLPAGYPRAPRRFSARALQALWSRTDWPPVEWLSGPVDVFHGTNFVLPPTRRAAGVVTIHDLAYDAHADTVTPASLRYRVLVPRALTRGAVAVTATHTVAEMIRERFAAEHVAVAPLGVDPEWFAPPGTRPSGLPTDYLVFVGSREPRKNLPVLLDALARVPDAPPLVLLGPPGWGPEIEARPGVVVPGYLSGADLVATVAGARALVLPSRDEGFGLPPVEALAAGVPVVVSDLPVLREVLGEHATYAAPGDPDALAAAIEATLRDPGDRAAGRAHAATYTWARCAAATQAAYDTALRMRR